jgi:hypothetical protein
MFDIKAAVLVFITALESVSGTPIAILDRVDDPQEFWARTAAILCDKTGDNFCDTNVRFMTANTEPSGYSQIVEYKVGKTGETKRVCALLPPTDTIDPSFVAEAFTGAFTRENDYPSNASTAAWLYLYHAAHCLDTEMSKAEDNRAIAFASLGLTILQGDPLFTSSGEKGQSRLIATMIKKNAAYWAVGTGERILFDQFKQDVATVLRKRQCNAVVQKSDEINTPKIKRDSALTPGQDCSWAAGGAYRNSGSVTDSNVWIWMYGHGGLGAPPIEYKPAEMFPTMQDAAKYTWATAVSLAK